MTLPRLRYRNPTGEGTWRVQEPEREIRVQRSESSWLKEGAKKSEERSLDSSYFGDLSQRDIVAEKCLGPLSILRPPDYLAPPLSPAEAESGRRPRRRQGCLGTPSQDA